jgi:dihydrofolate reductase
VEWPYKNKTTCVVSHRDTNLNETDNVVFITDEVIEHIASLKDEEGKDIWLVGGGKLITMLLNRDLVDEMHLCYYPVILEKGIALFPDNPKASKWEIVKTKQYKKGVLKADYQRIEA